MHMLVILSVNESSHFFFYFVTGAVHFFKQMNIGTLKIGDYLGTLNSNILSLSLSLLYVYYLHNLFLFTQSYSHDCSNRSNLCCNGFCVHLAGINVR